MAKVDYASAIIVPAVALYGVTRFLAPNPNSLEFLTGQRVTASVVASGEIQSTAPAPGSTTTVDSLVVDPSSFAWDIEGDYHEFKNYEWGAIGKKHL